MVGAGLGKSASRKPRSMPGALMSDTISLKPLVRSGCCAVVVVSHPVATASRSAAGATGPLKRANGRMNPSLQVREWVDAVVAGVDRTLDRLRLSFACVPQADVVRVFQLLAVGPREHLDARPVGIRRVRLQDDGDFAGVEAHQVAGRVNADEL